MRQTYLATLCFMSFVLLLMSMKVQARTNREFNGFDEIDRTSSTSFIHDNNDHELDKDIHDSEKLINNGPEISVPMQNIIGDHDFADQELELENAGDNEEVMTFEETQDFSLKPEQNAGDADELDLDSGGMKTMPLVTDQEFENLQQSPEELKEEAELLRATRPTPAPIEKKVQVQAVEERPSQGDHDTAKLPALKVSKKNRVKKPRSTVRRTRRLKDLAPKRNDLKQVEYQNLDSSQPVSGSGPLFQ